tara:strand:+ start:191 stop:394 length:204 start_codon:yes stop_codon:yes gene_type:complete
MATVKENSQRINKIETDVAVIKNDISTIKDNHLAHIETDMKKLDMRMWWVLSILIVSIVIPFVRSMW